MTSLALEELSYTYHAKNMRTDAVRAVTFNFEAGKIYAVMGKSGCGKTTLLSLLAGLDKPTSGTVCLNGQNVADLDMPRYRREQVAMIYQQFNLLPLFTTLENVMYPMILGRKKEAEARTAAQKKLRALGLDERFDKRFPSTLSGGEQQRVAIARALCTPAQVILADEPTGSLDAENGEKLMDILVSLAHEQGYLVIIVTHDPQVASRTDKIITMVSGKFLTV